MWDTHCSTSTVNSMVVEIGLGARRKLAQKLAEHVWRERDPMPVLALAMYPYATVHQVDVLPSDGQGTSSDKGRRPPRAGPPAARRGGRPAPERIELSESVGRWIAALLFGGRRSSVGSGSIRSSARPSRKRSEAPRSCCSGSRR